MIVKPACRYILTLPNALDPMTRFVFNGRSLEELRLSPCQNIPKKWTC